MDPRYYFIFSMEDFRILAPNLIILGLREIKQVSAEASKNFLAITSGLFIFPAQMLISI